MRNHHDSNDGNGNGNDDDSNCNDDDSNGYHDDSNGNQRRVPATWGDVSDQLDNLAVRLNIIEHVGADHEYVRGFLTDLGTLHRDAQRVAHTRTK